MNLHTKLSLILFTVSGAFFFCSIFIVPAYVSYEQSLAILIASFLGIIAGAVGTLSVGLTKF